MVKKYLIKRSQVVAILIFLVEIIGSFALVQIDASENILGKIGYVAIIYGVLSTIALYQVKKEWDVFLIFMIMCYLFSFGQCILTAFVRSIYSVLPNFLNLEYISIDEVFSPYYTVTNAGCGASFIAEGYWNFGYFSVLFFIALGYVWGTLSNRFKQLCNSKYVKPENFFVIVYLMYYMIFLVRSESIELGRSFVYYAVIPILISKLLKTKTVRGGKTS